MDNFSYNYSNIESNSVDGKVCSKHTVINSTFSILHFQFSVFNSSLFSFHSYDQLGQLISDQQEMIASIEWRSGDKKIKTLTRAANAGNKSDLEFIYNPMGQRILKIEKPKVNNELQTRDWWRYTYYTYDANSLSRCIYSSLNLFKRKNITVGRQVMATYEVTLSTALNRAYLKDQNIYGATRLGMRNKYIALYENGTSPYTIPDVQQNTLGDVAYEITNYLGNVNVVISDRKIWVTNAFKACVVSRTDYFPFGMEISSRTLVSDNYKYGYVGLERDNEVSGNGNSYNTEYRQYDPRLGRWKSCDPKRHWFPSMSAYCYASNSPIAGKDDNGLYTIFVNGYTGDGVPGNWNEAPPGYQYWRGSSKNPSQFINAAHDYFGDGFHKFIDGSGDYITSTASTRQEWGRELGKIKANEILAEILKLNNDCDPTNDVKEINFVTHSMGAAVAEGMIEEFMKNDYLRSLMEKGEIVHFSAADGNRIKISENSKNLKRYQLNYLQDITLARADPGSKTGGYKIKGVNSFGVVNSNSKDWGYKDPLHDFHYDSKTFKMTWDFLKVLQQKINSGGTGTIKIEKSDLKTINNWDHRDGSRGQKIPNDLS